MRLVPLMPGVIALSVALAAVLAGPAAGADVEGSRDHPMVSRFPGAEIVDYQVIAFDQYRLAVGNAMSGYPAQTTDVELLEGRVTRIQYSLSGRANAFEVYRNYADAAEDAGFTAIWQAQGRALGPRSGDAWSRAHYRDLHAGGRMPGELSQSVDPAERRYLAARLTRPVEGDVYLALLVNQHRDDDVRVQLDIVELEGVRADLIAIDPDYLAEQIAATGSVVVQGIHFETNRAEIRPESAPALEAMAGLLTAQPDLSVYIVGHTDMTGDFGYNMELSRDRARAVVEALVTRHGIAAERLEGHGVGPLAPMASNNSDDGRAGNRRVVLVPRLP